jgi:hypothetical protein
VDTEAAVAVADDDVDEDVASPLPTAPSATTSHSASPAPDPTLLLPSCLRNASNFNTYKKEMYYKTVQKDNLTTQTKKTIL